eukprot:NODE_88_length_21789_cov_0.534440.p10 type:complete len:239 gc:universal NODE_88_length_21789_cov_0.534440:4939-5655(+)
MPHTKGLIKIDKLKFSILLVAYMVEIDFVSAIVPVLVEDVLGGRHAGATHVIEGHGVTNISLCGKLIRIEDQLGQPWYKLNDATGNVKVAYDIDQEQVEECGCAKVIGSVRTDANGDIYIQAYTINASNDINALSCHILEKKFAFKLYKHGLPPTLKEQYNMGDMLPISGPVIQQAQSGDTKEALIEFLRNNGTKSNLQQLESQFQGIDLSKLLYELENEDGLIYSGGEQDNPEYTLF